MLSVEAQWFFNPDGTFKLKPLLCPLGRPFCLGRGRIEEGVKQCLFYCHIIIQPGGKTIAMCHVDDYRKNSHFARRGRKLKLV